LPPALAGGKEKKIKLALAKNDAILAKAIFILFLILFLQLKLEAIYYFGKSNF
jgi:hypothetical protein